MTEQDHPIDDAELLRQLAEEFEGDPELQQELEEQAEELLN